jgi:hypothetical protein
MEPRALMSTPRRSRRFATLSAFVLCIIASTLVQSSSRPARADCTQTQPGNRTKGCWDRGPDWRQSPIHMSVLRGAISPSQVVWWTCSPEESTSSAVVRRYRS